MIRYDKGWWGLKTFGKMYGSAFPKALPFSLTASIFAGLLSYFFAKELDEAFIHPYPFQTFAFVAGFMVVFRCVLFSAVLDWSHRLGTSRLPPHRTQRAAVHWPQQIQSCLLYTSPSPRDRTRSRMPSSA